MCRIGNLMVTSWHPVRTAQTPDEWGFPVSIAKTADYYSGIVCSVLLEPDKNVDAHAIWFGGVWGVTLGHGILGGDDVRAHEFLGDYNAVMGELKKLGPGEHGVYCGGGTKRNPETGRLCGFERLPSTSIDDAMLETVGTQSPEICA